MDQENWKNPLEFLKGLTKNLDRKPPMAEFTHEDYDLALISVVGPPGLFRIATLYEDFPETLIDADMSDYRKLLINYWTDIKTENHRKIEKYQQRMVNMIGTVKPKYRPEDNIIKMITGFRKIEIEKYQDFNDMSGLIKGLENYTEILPEKMDHLEDKIIQLINFTPGDDDDQENIDEKEYNEDDDGKRSVTTDETYTNEWFEKDNMTKEQ